jgi:hypothetical protein
LPVAKETDVFFYGYGDKFRQEWTATMIGEPSRRLPDVASRWAAATPGRRRQSTARRGRALQRVQPRDLRRSQFLQPAQEQASEIVRTHSTQYDSFTNPIPLLNQCF